MAELKGTIRLDTSEVINKLKGVGAEGDKAFKQIQDAFNKKLQVPDTSNAAKAFDAMRTSLSASISEQKSALASLIATGQQGSQAFTDVKTQLLASAQEARKLDNALEAVNKEVDSVNSKKITIGDQLKQGLASGIAGGLIGGGVAGAVSQGVGLITEGFSKAISLGSEFQTGMASLSAVTGATGPLLEKLGGSARDLSTQFGGGVNAQLGLFQVTLSKIGPQLAQSPEALAKFAENVNILSKTDSALGAAGAVDALTGSMLQFGVDVNNSNEVASESTRFINVLAASAKVGSATVSQVAEAVAVVGATAKNANQSFEGTNAALQVLASKSLVGAQAGTALTTVLVKLQSQSAEGDDALAALGTSSAELGQLLNEQGLPAAMAKLGGAMDKLGSQAEKNALLNKLFGEGGQNAAAALLSGKDMLAQFTEGVTGTNSATEQAAVNMNTFAEFMSRLRAQVEDFAVGAFDGISKFVSFISERLGPVLGNLVEKFSTYFQKIWTVVQPILAVVGAGIVTWLVQSVTTAATVLATLYDIANRVFTAIGRAVQPVIDQFKRFFGAQEEGFDIVTAFGEYLDILITAISETGAVVAEVGGFLVELLITPLQMAMSVVADLVGFFADFNKEQKDTGKNVKENKPLIDQLKETFNNIKGTIAGLTESFGLLKEVVGQFFERLRSLDIAGAIASFSNLGQRLGKAYDTGFNNATEKTFDALGNVVPAASATQSAFKIIKEQIDEAAKKALTASAQEVAAIKKTLSERTNAALQAKKLTADEAVELNKLIDLLRSKASSGGSSLATKQTEFDLIKKELEAEQKRAENQTRLLKTEADGKLSKQGQIDLDTKALEIAKKLQAEYARIFGFGDKEIISKLNFKTDKDQNPLQVLADINKQFADLAGTAIAAQLKVSAQIAFDPAAAVDNAKDALKGVEDAFRGNAESLAKGLIDKQAFAQTVEGLGQTLKNNIETLNLALPQIKDEKAQKAVAELVTSLQKKIEELQSKGAEALAKLDAEAAKKRIDLNKRTAELLLADEAKNRAEILKLLNENIDLETKLKIDALTGSAEMRAEETRIIIAEADKQRKALLDKYREPLPGLSGFAVGFLASLSTAFDEAARKQKAQRDATIEGLRKEESDLKESLKNEEGSIQSFYQKQAELKKKLAEADNGGIPILKAIEGGLLAQGSKAIEKFSTKAFEDFKTAAESGASVMSTLGDATIALLGGALAKATADGKLSVKELIGTLLDGLNAIAPIIIAQMFGLYASSPNPANVATLGGAGATAAAIVTASFLALVNIARAAVGVDQGIVGITKAYSKRPSQRDVIPALMRIGESAIVPEATQKNEGILTWFNKTHGYWQDYAMQQLSVAELQKMIEKKGGSTMQLPPSNMRLDFGTSRQVVTLEMNNAMMQAEMKMLRKEIRSLKGEISTYQKVEIIPRVDADGFIKHIYQRNASRRRAH